MAGAPRLSAHPIELEENGVVLRVDGARIGGSGSFVERASIDLDEARPIDVRVLVLPP